MKLLSVNGDNIEITPEGLQIKEFKNIWNRDKKKDKERALSELAFIYYLVDWQSPYRLYIDKEEKEQKILLDLFDNGKWEKDVLVIEACKKYEELIMTDSILLLKDAKGAISKLRKYFRDVDLSERDEKSGKPIYSAKDLITNIKQVGQVIRGMKELEDEIAKEQMYDLKIRGGGQAGAFENPE